MRVREGREKRPRVKLKVKLTEGHELPLFLQQGAAARLVIALTFETTDGTEIEEKT